jgi:hypothetical protein
MTWPVLLVFPVAGSKIRPPAGWPGSDGRWRMPALRQSRSRRRAAERVSFRFLLELSPRRANNRTSGDNPSMEWRLRSPPCNLSGRSKLILLSDGSGFGRFAPELKSQAAVAHPKRQLVVELFDMMTPNWPDPVLVGPFSAEWRGAKHRALSMRSGPAHYFTRPASLHDSYVRSARSILVVVLASTPASVSPADALHEIGRTVIGLRRFTRQTQIAAVIFSDARSAANRC